MAELPSGTITVLHTDIQDSVLLRVSFADHEGYEVDTQGDSFFVVLSAQPDNCRGGDDSAHPHGHDLAARRGRPGTHRHAHRGTNPDG